MSSQFLPLDPIDPNTKQAVAGGVGGG
jgi:hypothetical protein